MPVLSKKRDNQNFGGGFALSGLLGSAGASMLPLGTRMAFFPSLKQNFIAYRSSKVQIAFLKFTSSDNQVYSNCYCSCSFEPEIIKIVMYCNNILNFQESMTILNVCTKKGLETYWMHHVSCYTTQLSFCSIQLVHHFKIFFNP